MQCCPYWIQMVDKQKWHLFLEKRCILWKAVIDQIFSRGQKDKTKKKQNCYQSIAAFLFHYVSVQLVPKGRSIQFFIFLLLCFFVHFFFFFPSLLRFHLACLYCQCSFSHTLIWRIWRRSFGFIHDPRKPIAKWASARLTQLETNKCQRHHFRWQL